MMRLIESIKKTIIIASIRIKEFKIHNFRMDYKLSDSTNHSTFNDAFNVSSSFNLSTRNKSLLSSFEDNGQPDQNYFGIIETSLSLLGAVLNISIIISLLSMKQSLKTQFKLILSLAVSDCMIAMFHFILRFFTFPNWSKLYSLESSAYRLILSVLYISSQYAGLGTMCTIAVDIFIKVRKPLKYRILMSKTRGNVIVTCLWVVPVLLFMTIALCLTYNFDNFYEGLSLTRSVCSSVYFILCLLFLFIFVIMYTIIFCSVRRRVRSSQRRTTLKMVFTFFLIIISYFVCMLPMVWLVLLINTNALNSRQNPDRTMSFVSCLYILNTAIDPIIYAVRVPEIRARFRTIGERVFHLPRPSRENTRN